MKITRSSYSSLILVAVALLLFPQLASAKPKSCKIVNQTSSGKFDNLQAAVDAAVSGDQLKIKGTCTGSTEIFGKDLSLVGHSNPAFGEATLDGSVSQGNPVLTVIVSDISVRGLVITGGTSSGGSGIRATFSSVSLYETRVSGNSATDVGGGGGIFGFRSDIVLHNSTVRDNYAGYGGGIGAVCLPGYGSVFVNDSVISDNTADNPDFGRGGGLFNSNCAASISDSNVSDNFSRLYGGGIFNQNVYGNVSLFNSGVTNNRAGIQGGGIYNHNLGVTMIDSLSSIFGNLPDDCFGSGCN